MIDVAKSRESFSALHTYFTADSKNMWTSFRLSKLLYFHLTIYEVFFSLDYEKFPMMEFMHLKPVENPILR